MLCRAHSIAPVQLATSREVLTNARKRADFQPQHVDEAMGVAAGKSTLALRSADAEVV